LAPDELTSVGGYPGDDEKGVALQAKLDQKKMMEELGGSGDLLEITPRMHRKKWVLSASATEGVWRTNLAVRMPELGAAVPFYGMQPSAEDVAKIKSTSSDSLWRA